MDAELAEPGRCRRPPVTSRFGSTPPRRLPLDPPVGRTADLYLVRAGRPRVQLVIADLQVVAARSQDGVPVVTCACVRPMYLC